MSTTRLLILGAVRIFQPVHGYFVRKELVSWEVDCWAHLNPGSVYNALQKLSRDGLLVESTTDASALGAARTTTYSLTNEGDQEFLSLLRAALGTVDEYAADSLMAGVAFMWALPREEVKAALVGRLDQLTVLEENSAQILEHKCLDPETPDHVQEIQRLVFARLRGEKDWTGELIDRIGGDAYAFAGEPTEGHFPRDPRC
ncbi:MAG: PadR family transcriptional regulator [Actinomycetota bacterium]